MPSCYGVIAASLAGGADCLGYLPIKTTLPDGTRVEVDYFHESEHEAGHRLLNDVIEEGLTWPFEEALDMDGFRAYFLSHAAFVVRRVLTPQSSTVTSSSSAGNLYPSNVVGDGVRAGATTRNDSDHDGAKGVDVLGVFYIKPNFPGRCSHVCNGGFITDPRARRRGVARLMGQAFLRFAGDLGYKASYFNLVFRNNEASLRLWRGLGFTELAVVPKAGRLKGIDGLVDAIQFYYDLELLQEQDLPEYLRGSA